MKAPVVLVTALCLLAPVTDADEPISGPADAVVAAIEPLELRELLTEVLEHYPEIAALEAKMIAAGERSTSARKLPDPTAELTAFILPPETRVGRQRFAARFTQRLPGGGKRTISVKAETFDERALEAELQALRLSLVTQCRRLLAEIGYLDRARQVLADDHATLAHFEELARARYASGSGLQMEAIQIQAEMTWIQTRLAEFNERRAALTAEINRLRDRPGAPVDAPAASGHPRIALDWTALRERALASRPELAAAEARIGRSAAAVDLAGKQRSPDFSVGLTYAYVEKRDDVDVPDNGRDILGISGGITIPLWKRATDAEVEAATWSRIAREADRRNTTAAIERQIEDLRGRIPEIERRLGLLEDVLPIQSEQALASAEAAYIAGRVDALSLLDAERVLLDVRLAAARSRTDYAIALITLEGVIAGPLQFGEAS